MFHLYNLFTGLFIIIGNYLYIHYYLVDRNFFPSFSQPFILLRDTKVFAITFEKIFISRGTF
jgi:hypothetical protein